MDKRFWAIIGVVIVIFGGIVFFKGNNKASAPSSVNPTNHTLGQGKSGVTFVEYGDFQCPYCASYYPVVKQVVEKYDQDITFQFRNLPLTQVHSNAFAAARAAEAADAQGKFWEMYDTLYNNQQSWSRATNVRTMFNQYAKQLGLNTTQFEKDFASSKVNDRINADIAAFNKTGRPMSTPTFFINNKPVDIAKLVDDKNLPNIEKFSAVIEGEIAKKKQQ